MIVLALCLVYLVTGKMFLVKQAIRRVGNLIVKFVSLTNLCLIATVINLIYYFHP